jgi:ABC-type multidrug transport system ATPase subunit
MFINSINITKEKKVGLEITGVKEHKGFLLKNSTTLDQKIIILTGRNGSGKTRFIESLHNQCTSILLNGSILGQHDIKIFPQTQLIPSFGINYNYLQYQIKLTNTLAMFDQIKADLDSPFNQDIANSYNRMHNDGALGYSDIFKLCLSISETLGKKPSQLSHDDITLHYEEPIGNVLGIQNISTIVNQYIKRSHDNRMNKWRSTEENEDVIYLSDEEFIQRFGQQPWIIINEILNDTFDGKFQFNIPDEKSKSYSYQAQLIQTNDQQLIAIDSLSSGEKTLLWLALTLFNSQYYDPELVNTPKLLLLDEPDAFLHPKMVIKMYKVLESFKNNYNSIIIITTHSPTTVALAPEDSTFVVFDNSVSPVTKDEAITELLDGITQISINPHNRRQVFVESNYDSDTYQAIYLHLAHNSQLIDPKISLNFVSSGPKMPEQQLKDKAKQILKIEDNKLLEEFVISVNGIGNCVQVIGQVESLEQNDNETVRGIIDWDLKNEPSKYVSVLAHEYAYSIENITLDPICILLLLNADQPTKFTMTEICGEDIHWSYWLTNDDLLQISIDRFILKVLGSVNLKNCELKYVSSDRKLFSDTKYLMMKGHDLEKLVISAYPSLKTYARSNKDGELKYSIVLKSMINLTNGKFIPKVFEEVLTNVQK